MNVWEMCLLGKHYYPLQLRLSYKWPLKMLDNNGMHRILALISVAVQSGRSLSMPNFALLFLKWISLLSKEMPKHGYNWLSFSISIAYYWLTISWAVFAVPRPLQSYILFKQLLCAVWQYSNWEEVDFIISFQVSSKWQMFLANVAVSNAVQYTICALSCLSFWINSEMRNLNAYWFAMATFKHENAFFCINHPF